MLTIPAGYPETLAFLTKMIHGFLGKRLGTEMADQLAVDLMEAIRLQLGGMLIYFPKGTGFSRIQRNERIYMEFDGRNHAELARRYGLNQLQIYRILKTKRHDQQCIMFEKI